MLSDGTYDFFAHLERSGALQGLNIWELRRHLDEHRLAEIMIPNLAAKGIVLSDATAQLSEEDRITVGEAFFTARMQMGEEAAARHIAAAATLQSLQTTCQQNHYPSRKEAMIDRWAKAFYEGNYVARKAEIEKAIGEKKTIGGNFNNEAGVSYVRIVGACSIIAGNWKTLPEELNEAAAKEEGPQTVLMALEAALDDYWTLIDNIAKGLGQEGVVYWVGGCFQSILRAQRDVACKPNMLQLVKALGEGEVKKVGELFTKTDTKLGAALKAAGA